MRLWIISLALAIGAAARAETLLVPEDYATIQDAIDAAVNGDQVLVGPGTYVECIDYLGKAIAVRSTAGKSETVIDASPFPILFLAGEGRDSVLEGFTVVNGGVWCDNSSPTIRGNTIGPGRGVVVGNSSPPDPEGALIAGNEIIGNFAEGTGAGIHVGFAPVVIEGNVIAGNIVEGTPPCCGLGGGIFVHSFGSQTVVIRNNLICGNQALGSGFGQGGGVWFEGTPDTVFENNTIVGNFASLHGGGLRVFGAELTIRNCIVWGNEAPAFPQIVSSSATFEVFHSDVEGGWPGTGNIDADPLFVDGPLGDRYLTASSPCIDAGDPATSLLDGTTQIDQSPDTGVIDLGFHYPTTPEFVRGDCNADGAFDIGDAIFTLNTLFVPGSPGPTCGTACDSNADGTRDISDAIYTLSALFTFGRPPPAPYPGCGHDPSGAPPECDEFGACP